MDILLVFAGQWERDTIKARALSILSGLPTHVIL